MPPRAADLGAQPEDDEEDEQECVSLAFHPLGRELLAALHAMQAKKVRANLKKQEGLVPQGAELVRQYQESVIKLLEGEKGAIQARIQQFDEEEARIAKEARETEKTLLDLLHSQSISVIQGEKVDVDNVAAALWHLSSEEDGGDAMEGVESWSEGGSTTAKALVDLLARHLVRDGQWEKERRMGDCDTARERSGEHYDS
ncbi:hypothetical protein OF846_005367 [Rhodotorula toruloides]|nr:hypothetical protein OF846_005367 [Rhodotorula toruloides]